MQAPFTYDNHEKLTKKILFWFCTFICMYCAIQQSHIELFPHVKYRFSLLSSGGRID